MNILDILSGETLAAFGSGSALVAGFNFIKWYLKRVERLEEKEITKVLRKKDAVYRHLNNIMYHLPCARILICRCENGGEVPKLGKALYSNVAYEICSKELQPAYAIWQKQILDANYIKLLLRLDLGEDLVLKTRELMDGTLLKNVFLAQSIKQVNSFAIHKLDGQFFYMVIHFTEEHDLAPVEWDMLRTGLAQIRAIFKEVYAS